MIVSEEDDVKRERMLNVLLVSYIHNHYKGVLKAGFLSARPGTQTYLLKLNQDRSSRNQYNDAREGVKRYIAENQLDSIFDFPQYAIQYLIDLTPTHLRNIKEIMA